MWLTISMDPTVGSVARGGSVYYKAINVVVKGDAGRLIFRDTPNRSC